MIEIEGLSFKYVGRKRPTLRDISLTVQAGESVLVLGPSGCGKSTLALCLNGAIPGSISGDFSGSVRVGGLDTRRAGPGVLARRVGIVFQDPEAQFCMLSVEDEVAFGLENQAVPRSEMDARIDAALATVGLADRRQERIERLSGGQKQRLALACVLVQRPDVIVLDEPTAQLDPAAAAEVMALLGRLRASGNHTLVIVEHRLDDAISLVDRVIVLNAQGELIADGPPREVIHQHGAWLREAGVWTPHVSELALALEDRGLSVRPFPLTVEEAESALRPLVPLLAASEAPSVPGVRPAADVVAQVRGLSFTYPRATAPTLHDLSLTLRAGELVAIVGANGAGKSTLARLLAGIPRPPAGTVKVMGLDAGTAPMANLARQVGYVFQYPEHQFVGQTVLDDVAYGPRRSGLSEAEAVRLAREMLADFGLTRYEAAHPFTLSHGEQRRLSVASMLVLGQRLLLLDEPTFGQDQRNATMLLDKLEGLAAAGRTVVAVSHDMRLVAERTQRVLVMADGAILFDGAPAKLFANRALLERAALRPPPLWELSERLGLERPLRTDRLSDLIVAPAPVASGVAVSAAVGRSAAGEGAAG